MEDIAGNLLPDELVKPKEVDSNSWRDESAKAFLFRLYKSGLADNRYHVFEHTRRADDLYKLDQLYFAIFRLCCFLDYPQLGESRYGQSDTTNREHLEKNPNYNPNSNPTRLKELMEGYNPELVHAAKNENYPFSPEFQHQRITCGSSRQTPVLRRTIIDPDEKYPDKKKMPRIEAQGAADLTTWVLNNIKLPKSVQVGLEDIRDRMKTRSDPTPES